MEKSFVVFLLIGFGFIFLTANKVFSQEAVLCGSVSSCQEKIVEYQKKLSELKNKENSLGNEINFMETQIALTGAKIVEVRSRIAEKEAELTQLSIDITDLEVRLDRVSRSLSFQRDIFSQRATASYKSGRISFLELFMMSGSFSEFISRFKYLKILELSDQKLLKQMEETRKNFTAQKVIVRDKKDKVTVVKKAIEAEKKNLESYQSSLSVQRKEKQLLLTVTKNDEAYYRTLISKALAEKEAFERAILGLQLKDGQPIKKGETIALMGNSGFPNCSTGTHLHLEVRKNGQAISPADFLGDHPVTYEDGVASMAYRGNWVWPLSDLVTISQEFGMSFFAKRGFYGGGPHTGIDMYNMNNSSISAVADGVLYKGSTSCGSSLLKYVAIDHGSGLFSYYFHIQ